jgi:hypothetical protein
MRMLANGGLQYIGRDVEDLWATRQTTYPVDISNIPTAACAAHGIYHNAKSQVWFWITTGNNTTPDTKLVFDVRLGRSADGGVRGGWSRHTGASATAWCSTTWNTTYTIASPYGRSPIVGSTNAVGIILKCDTGTQNYAMNYQAYVTTKPYSPGGLGVNCAIGQSHLLAAAQAGVVITQTINRDYGLETRNAQVELTPTASETRVLKQFDGSEMAGAGQVQFTVGDVAAANNTWTLDALVAPYLVGEDR